MDQLASMLARSAMPAGMAPSGTGAPDSAAAPTPAPPLLQGVADSLPDREVCAFS
jgi:hypothetical protein